MARISEVSIRTYKHYLELLQKSFSGLSPIMVQEIGKVVRDVKQGGRTIILVEQNARLALKLSHRGCVLEMGCIVLGSNCQELQRSEIVKRAYLGP